MTTRMPSIKDVASALRHVKQSLDRGQDIDVRLQVYPSGSWSVHSGDSSYDQDHSGFWGASGLDKSSNCRDVAKELIDQADDHAAQCGEDD